MEGPFAALRYQRNLSFSVNSEEILMIFNSSNIFLSVLINSPKFRKH